MNKIGTLQIQILKTEECWECRGIGRVDYPTYHDEYENRRCMNCKGDGVVDSHRAVSIEELKRLLNG